MKVKVEEALKPKVVDAKDVVLKVTGSTVCVQLSFERRRRTHSRGATRRSTSLTLLLSCSCGSDMHLLAWVISPTPSAAKRD